MGVQSAVKAVCLKFGIVDYKTAEKCELYQPKANKEDSNARSRS